MNNLINIIKIYLKSYSGLSKECWQSIFLTFFESLANGICFFLSLYFVNNLHISLEKSGLLISLYGIGTILGGILGGKLSDIFSAKKIASISLSFQTLFIFLLSKIHNPALLSINMFLLGCCLYGFMTANNLWLLKQCNNKMQKKIKSINISRAASNLGMGLSGVLIGFINIKDFNFILYFSSLIMFFLSFYQIFFIADDNKISLAQEKASLNSLENINKNKKIMLLMLFCLFSVGLIISQLSITYPLYILNKFPVLGMQAVSFLFVLDTLIISIFQAPLTSILYHHNKIYLVGIGSLLMGVGMFLLNFSTVFFLAIISCLFWTTGEMIFVPMVQLVCYECGLENKKGQAMGIAQAFSAASKVLGPSIGGYIYYHFSGDVLWTLSFAIGCLCFSACLYFRSYNFSLTTHSNTASNEGTIASKPSF